MAGFFGMLDFTREGPGVDKNAPKKRAFVTFGGIYRRKFWSLMHADLWYLLLCLPLVTRGWAQAGLTFITRSFAREKHAFVREDFFDTIRKNRGQAFVCGLINLLVTGVLLYNLSYYLFGLFPELRTLLVPDAPVSEPITMKLMDYIVLGASVMGYVVFTFMKYYIPFLVITFKLNLRQVYRNAMIFSMAGLKENVLISVILTLVYGLLLVLLGLLPYVIVYFLVCVLAVLVVPGFRSLLIQYTVFPVIRKLMIDPYYAEHPDADQQQRRDLNLEVEEPVEEEAAAPAAPEPSRIPRQYSEQELRRFSRRDDNTDEENTI